jgi:ribosomal protein S27AE
MKRLMPGVYDDEQGGLHLDVAEMLVANGWADTPENRATLLEAAREAFGPAKVTETHAPIRAHYTCPRCGAVSCHPTDLAERYCGRCHQFEEL